MIIKEKVLIYFLLKEMDKNKTFLIKMIYRIWIILYFNKNNTLKILYKKKKIKN